MVIRARLARLARRKYTARRAPAIIGNCTDLDAAKQDDRLRAIEHTPFSNVAYPI
jgi:hypothetical protein